MRATSAAMVALREAQRQVQMRITKRRNLHDKEILRLWNEEAPTHEVIAQSFGLTRECACQVGFSRAQRVRPI